MCLRRLTPLCLLFLLVLCALPVSAAPTQPSNLRSDILYTSRGEFVQVSPMRPLTLNAHVEQFQYEPLGIEVAFVGSEVQGDQTTHFVKTMDVRTGHEMSRLTTSSIGDEHVGFLLLGWSPSAKYLLLCRLAPDPQNPVASTEEYLRWDLGANPPVTRPIDPAAHLPAGAQPVSGYGIASPTRRWIVFRQNYQLPNAEGKPGPQQTAYVLYDPDRDSYRLLALPPGATSYSWNDGNHLNIRQEDAVQQFDVISGQVSPRRAAPAGDAPAASKQYPDLTLDVEHRFQQDLKGSGASLDSVLLWIRRTPAGKQPLGVAAAGLTPDKDDPQAVWSPTGKQIAFLAHGDLCVTNLAPPADLLPREKMAVGLQLSCAEERVLAIANLKQIGLALVQYAQDNDEKYPAAGGIEESIYPYLKTRDVFSVGKSHWAFHPTPNPSLASIESPAETVQGTMDLPCAHLVLFYDGHVKSFPPQGSALGDVK